MPTSDAIKNYVKESSKLLTKKERPTPGQYCGLPVPHGKEFLSRLCSPVSEYSYAVFIGKNLPTDTLRVRDGHFAFVPEIPQ